MFDGLCKLSLWPEMCYWCYFLCELSQIQVRNPSKDLSSWAITHHLIRGYISSSYISFQILAHLPAGSFSTDCCRISLPLCTLTISCMAVYELSVALKAPNSHCSPEISLSPSGDIFTLWNSVHFPLSGPFLSQAVTESHNKKRLKSHDNHTFHKADSVFLPGQRYKFTSLCVTSFQQENSLTVRNKPILTFLVKKLQNIY